MAIDSIAVVGPTASGKTRRAVSVARAFDGEIISGDSRQVYRDMSIGTGKDLEEYEEVPYHLIDICDAGEKYNLHRYLKDFHEIYQQILKKGKLPVICGGSGMYVENALNGIRMPDVPPNNDLRRELEGKSLSELTDILSQYKTLHNSTDVDTVKRAVRAIEICSYYQSHPVEAAKSTKSGTSPLRTLVIGIDVPRDIRREYISSRLQKRLDSGMIEEVDKLLKRGISPEDLIYYGLEYKYITLYLIGKMQYDEMVKGLEIAIHQFAKRQMTWFRGMEKRGVPIEWLPYDLSDEDFLKRINELKDKS